MKKRLLLATIFVFACLIFMYNYITPSTKEENRGKIGVVVTILPQAEFVEKVGGDRVKVTVMVPPGASPHTYEPTASQLKEVSKAMIYFKVGSGVEFEITWWDKIISVNPNIIVVDGSKGIDIIDKDPHIWNSPKNAKKMVRNFYLALIQVDPFHKDEYKANMNRYLKELDELDNYIRNKISGFKNKAFIIYHSAFGYLANDYDLKQIVVEHKGKEPTPKIIQRCIDYAKKYNLSYVFTLPQFTTKHAEVIAKEIGGETIIVDPLPRNYVANMRSVINLLCKEFE